MSEVARALFQYRWPMLTVFFSTIIVTILLVYLVLSPKFESKATLIINSAEVLQPLINAPPETDFEKVVEFETQKDVLSSVRLAKEVASELDLESTRRIGNIEKLKIGVSRLRNWMGGVLGIERWSVAWDPEAAAIDAITKRLVIETAPQSKAIKLSYRAYDPDEAAAVLSQLIDSYQAYYYAQSTARANGILDYLEARIDTARTELIESEQAILEFRLKKRSTAAKDEAQYGTIDITDSTEVQDEFKLYILRMEEELRLLSQEAPADDPRIVALKEKLDAYVEAVNRLPQEEIELQRLKRRHTLAQDKYLLLARNLEQAKLMAMGQANTLGLISVLETPEADESPVSPKRKLILFFAVFLAFGLALTSGYVYRFFDTSIRTPQDFSDLPALRYLGSLPRLSP